ncbi:MAG: PrsW family intramembrane metalloprotease [Treponema sp.]|nr:PrsW family intramembrane metalloprotease [Treponema sp.]
MNIHIVISLCFVPLVACCLICRCVLKQNLLILLRAVLLGLLAIVPIMFIQFYLHQLISMLFFPAHQHLEYLSRALIVNGLIEETIKMAVLFLLPAKRMPLKLFFCCALICGLSLACFESVIYFLNSLQVTEMNGVHPFYRQILLRMFTANIIHLCCTGLCGLCVWALRHHTQAASAFLFAVIAHGYYNFFLLYTVSLRYFAIAAILFAAVECRVQYMKLRQNETLHKQFLNTNGHTTVAGDSLRAPKT